MFIMKYEIRLMRKENLEACAEVIRQGFMTVAKDFGLTKENCPTNGAFIQKDRLEAELEKGQLMYGVMDQEKIIGYMQLEKNTDELYFLQKLVVLPDYRHMGIGKMLLDYTKKLVTEWGGRRVSISIIEENIILKAWYMEYGFIPIRTHKFDHLPFTVGFLELLLN